MRDQALAQQRLVVATLGLTRREWAKMGAEFDASWATIGPRISLLTASAQLGAARNGAASVPAILAELGQSVDPLGAVNPSAFAGIASDGRPLDSLLYHGVIEAKIAARTMPPTEALAVGGTWLDMAIHTQVTDAGRGAAGVAIAARPKVGWIRQASGSSCRRCVPLLGKWFRFNQGFDRHPKDDCIHLPSTEAGSSDLLQTPTLDQITGLTKAEHKAISDGADPSQVINADRRIYDPATGKYRKSTSNNGMTTTEGTTRRGLAGQRLAGRQRLTPDGIYRIASDRKEALTLLKQHGYLL